MNFAAVFLVALALTGASIVNAVPHGKSSELKEVLEEFLALVPQKKIEEIAKEYLEKDEEVQAAVEYMKSDAFKELVLKIESIEDVKNFNDYLEEAGLDIYGLLNKLHKVIGLPPVKPGALAANVRITGGVAGLIADIKAILPVDKIKALYEEKLESSPAFAKLIEHFKSPRFQELVDALRANEEFQKIIKHAKEVGVDVKAIAELLGNLFGLEFPEILFLKNANFNH